MSQIVVPAAARSVITPVQQTTFQVGTYTPLTDTFTKVVDLNDHVSFWLVKVGLPQPEKVYARSSTIRVAGERITAWNYKNRHITLTLQLLYQSGTTALLQAVRSLLAAIENPPYRLAFAPPNASVLTYADVVAVSHTIPTDGKIILAKAISNITIDFECAPGFSGDRITLSNLVTNPGFEAPSGPAVNVFDDPLTTTNAYSTGGTISAGSGTMNIANGTLATFGSASWGPVNRWQIRFFWITGLTAFFFPHFQDSNNKLWVQVSGTSVQLWQTSGGTSTQLGAVTVSLTNTNYYWVVFTQFPAAPGSASYLSAQLVADNLGNPTGSTLATIATPSVAGATGGLSGPAGIEASGAQLSIGGPYTHTNQYTLFGPGVWIWGSSGTGMVAGGWEQNPANTYGGGAATSFGAGRLDLPPAGTVSASWSTYTGGAPSGAPGVIPASTGQTLAASAWAKTTSGLSGTGVVSLVVGEWDASGAFLRSTTLASVTGAHTSWTQLNGTVVAGASTAYADVGLMVVDSTAGASANATVWFDNVQCWNQTTTGQTVMPYCELRFPQSPAQLLLTGLQGDMASPAYLDVGVPIGAITIAEFQYTLGVRATPDGRGALIAGAQAGRAASSEIYVLNSAVYGGYTLSSSGTTQNYPVLGGAAGLLGAYHVFGAVYPNDTHYAYQSATLDLYELLRNDATATIYTAYSPVAAPWSPSTQQWYWYDAGAVFVPVSPVLAREDQTLKWLMLQLGMNDAYGSPANPPFYLGPVVLMPIDGGLVSALIFPNTSAVSNMWVWTYLDPPQLPVANALTSLGGWRNSIETTSAPNPSHAIGGINVSGPVNMLALADNELLLDPTNSGGLDSSPIMQAAAVLSDVLAGLTYPIHHEVQYTPFYLYPRQS